MIGSNHASISAFLDPSLTTAQIEEGLVSLVRYALFEPADIAVAHIFVRNNQTSNSPIQAAVLTICADLSTKSKTTAAKGALTYMKRIFVRFTFLNFLFFEFFFRKPFLNTHRKIQTKIAVLNWECLRIRRKLSKPLEDWN